MKPIFKVIRTQVEGKQTFPLVFFRKGLKALEEFREEDDIIIFMGYEK